MSETAARISTTDTTPKQDDTARTVIFHVHEDHAAEILKIFDVPLPPVSDLDEIRIKIRH